MSDDPADWKAKAAAGAVEWAKKHPIIALLAGAICGLYLLADRHPNFAASVLASSDGLFTQLPSGWVLCTLLLICYVVYRLERQLLSEKILRIVCDEERERLAVRVGGMEVRIENLSSTIEDLFSRLRDMDRRRSAKPVPPPGVSERRERKP